jgi:hypothetical protein
MSDFPKRLGAGVGLTAAFFGLGLTFDCYSKNGDSCAGYADLAEGFTAFASSTAGSTDSLSTIQVGHRSA